MTVPGQGILGVVSGGQTLVGAQQDTQGTGASISTTTGAVIPPSTGGIKLPNLTSGWYVFFGLMAGILVSGTQAAPIGLGLIGVAFLYQLQLLLEGK